MPLTADARDRLREWRHAVARIYLSGINAIVPFILAIMLVARPAPKLDASFYFVLVCWLAFMAARFLAPSRAQALIVVALLMGASAVGPWFLGLSPGPFLSGASGVLLVAAIYGRRPALVMIALLTLSLLLAGVLVSTGTVDVLNRSSTDPFLLSNWVRLTLFTALTVGLLLFVLTGLFERMEAAWQATAVAAERERLEHEQRRAAEQRAVEAQRLEAIGRLADAVMPGLPTQDLIAEFRRVLPDAPVLVCSGYVEEELVRRGIAEGTVALLPKPFAGSALVARIRQLLVAKDEPPSS